MTEGQQALRSIFSTIPRGWGRPGIYLEDLFVEPELRGLGIGKALLASVAAIAVEKGCQRFEWAVLDWNTPAIEFYRAMGAEFMDEWRIVRMTGEALRGLAVQANGACAAPAVRQTHFAPRNPAEDGK